MSTIHQILKKHWGYSQFRPMQEEIIQSVISGKDTLALLPTGGGKSICFQVPALAINGLCLVISPLIALMKDQVENLNNKNIKASALYSGMHKVEIERVLSNCLFGETKFLYVSPERLKSDDFLTNLTRMKIGLIAVDEAHCISQWGYDFRPPYLEIADIRQYFPNTPIIALTATATPVVVDDIQNKLKFKEKNIFQKSFARSNLIYLTLRTENKLERLLRIIYNIKGTGIVYVRNRRKTQEIAEFLQTKNITADYYHAGLKVEERDKKQSDWIKGIKQIIVSTNAFGMGIDKPDVRFVVHLDIPDSIEAYFQEAGRGGRDEKKSWAFLLYDELDLEELQNKYIENFPELSFIRNVYKALCNYLQIPMEHGKDRIFEFEFAKFAKEYNFRTLSCYNALKFLEKEGYFVLNEAYHKPSRITINCSHEEIYNFQVQNKKLDPFIKTILRSYGGLYSSFVQIKEQDIANRLNIGYSQVISNLIQLEQNGIIIYDQQTDKPQIIFTENRIDENHITLSFDRYQFLKETAKKRIDAMLNYTTNLTKCRSKLLLEYFGEINSMRCGECNICIKRNKMNINDFEFNNTIHIIKPLLQKQTMKIEDVVKSVDIFTEEKTIEIIRWLIDKGKISIMDDKTLKWIKQKKDAE